MAINTYENFTENNGPTNTSSCSKFSNKNSQFKMKIDCTTDDIISNCNSKCDKLKRKINASPYLTEDRFELLSRITEKRLISKKTTDFFSSYPLAVNIYKASSDEFKSLKKNKKIKKSVLTLPNEPAPLPQACTVSDMNESEYSDKKVKNKKKKPTKMNRKPRINKPMQVFDRDAEYCSRLNIDLDSSSTDMISQFPGDGKKSMRRCSNVARKSDNNAHDVWAIVRKINRFHFRPTPPFSEDSINSIKKFNVNNKRRNKQMDTKVIETTTTEEFTYYSNLEDKSIHNSQSSLDCITVIDKQDEYQELCEKFKAVKNKVEPNIKNQKNIKKCKINAKPISSSPKHIHSGEVSVEHFHQNNMNLKHRYQKPKKSQRKVQNQDDNIMLTYDLSNNTKLRCQNINSKKDKNEFNESDNQVHLIENSVSSIGDIKSFTGSSVTFEDTSNKISLCESQGQINGITKVVLSKGQKEAKTKKTYFGTTMPGAVLHPKLTQADIKRRLANIRFPLVILGKDQLTSAPFQVTHYEPPQFAGLDNAIWPFMQSWQKQAIVNSNQEDSFHVYDSNATQTLKGDSIEEINVVKINKGNNYLALRDKTTALPVPAINTAKINKVKAPKKSLQQFKEGMLQLILRKPSNECNQKNIPQEPTKQHEFPNVNIATNTISNCMLTNAQNKIIYTDGKKTGNRMSSYMKQPWSKGRWASDFIDNVMKKIKSGAYYNQDVKYSFKNPYFITKDDSVQTEINIVQHDVCQNSTQKCNSNSNIEEIGKTCDNFQSIPGFDNNPSDLQVETMNKSKIAIKHSVTNIIVQFDVVMPYEINNGLHGNQSFSCVSLTVPESHQKIFKSKTTIVNAILPAELCSILPKTMRKIIIDSQLPKIFEIGESNLPAKSILPQNENLIQQYMPVLGATDVTPECQFLGQGNFSNKVSKIIAKNPPHTKIIQDFLRKPYMQQKNDLLPNKLSNIQILHTFVKSPIELLIFKSDHSAKLVSETDVERDHQNTSMNGKCLELQPYKCNQQIDPALTINNVERVSVKLSAQFFSIQVNIMVNPSSDVYYNNILSVTTMGGNNEDSKVNSVLSGLTLDSLYNCIQKYIFEGNKMLANNIRPNIIDKCCDVPQITKSENCTSSVEHCVSKISNKKRTFKKLYKKCKSTSNIAIERSSIALKKIKSVDDFFLALGSAKTLASVIDGSAEKKIMTSIKEMKHWINEVTPRQALLILLLANKKDTSNLVRYRPVILQGIAVKRITRASELDMEIEVIEKEKLNMFSPYEGISYLPASVENQDSLFEELYWIAKTTASDYQKPFNDSSERLLRSLLEKRKKLNPSYLRVMARYVGLGLLKSPK